MKLMMMLLSFALILIISQVDAVAVPVHHELSRRSGITNTPHSTVPINGEVVLVKSYNFDLSSSNTFTADLYIKNLAFTKQVQICYSDTTVNWSKGGCLSASYKSSIPDTSYEIWSLSAKSPTNLGLGSQFFAQTTQNGQTGYDNNGTNNYALAPQVVIQSISCTAGKIAGTLQVQNLAYNKVINVVLSYLGNSFTSSLTVPANYVSGPNAANYETWSFSDSFAGAIGAGTKYYVSYLVNNQTYYDNNNGANYVFDATCNLSCPTAPTVDNTTLNAPPPSTCPLYSGKGIFFKTYISGTNYFAVEALSDTIFHFEVSGLRAPPKTHIWNSPMVDTDRFQQNFNGPQNGLQCNNDGTVLVTKRVKVVINPSTLAVTVFDRVLNKVLSTFSYAQLSSGQVNSITNPTNPQLLWTRESSQAVYGIAQSPGFDSGFDLSQRNSEGNWLGYQVNSPNGYGNMMDCGVNGGCFGYTQLPVVYHVAPGYQHAFFLDVPQTLSWDLACRVHSVTATTARSLRWFTIAGDSLFDLRVQYMKIVGKPTLPPKSALGYNQVKWGYKSFQEAYDELKGLYDANIPVDVMVFDLYWFGEVLDSGENSTFGTLAWDPTKFANATANIQKLRALGPGVSMIEEPYLGIKTATAQFFKSLPNGIVYNTTGKPFIQVKNWWGTGYEIDHTSSAAKLWAECKRCRLITGCIPDPKLCPPTLESTETSTEIVSHWQDLGEPEAFDPNAIYYGLYEDDGVSMNTHKSVTNVYQLLITKNMYENYVNHSLPRRPNAISRSGAPGVQRYGGGMWSADIASDRQAMKFQYGVKKHLTMAGIDFHASDVGGFHRNQCTGKCIRDLYTTWMGNAVWFDFPVKPHVSAADGDPTLNASAALMGDLASNQFNVRIRYSLMPFFYSLFYRASTLGEPVLTPMFMAYQNDPGTYNIGNQYKIGPIIATFTADNPYGGDFGRGVYLPANTTFYNYHTHEAIQSKGGYTPDISYYPFGNTTSSITTPPAVVQAGSIFPLAHVDENTKNHRCWDRKDSSVVCPNKWRVYPGDTSSFTWYDDDGETTAYQSGKDGYTLTATQSLAGNTLTVNLAAAVGTQPPKYPANRPVIFEIVIPAGFSNATQVSTNWSVVQGGGRLVTFYGPTQSIFTPTAFTVQFS